MQPLIFHVAVTLDGFISRSDGSVLGFPASGSHVDAYQHQLSEYAAIVMGRGTYEIGYKYGMKPGEVPYGQRPHHIFSATLDVPESIDLQIERGDTVATIDRIKANSAGPVYLCGGGRFAGYLLAQRRIDLLRLKLAPVVYGEGIRLFEGYSDLSTWDLLNVTRFDTGHMLLEYSAHDTCAALSSLQLPAR